MIHISLTPILFDQFSMRVMWFVGVGLMGIFLGFLNIAYWRTAGNDSIVRNLCISANCISIIFGTVYLFVDRDPQGFLVVALFIYLTFASFFIREEAPKSKP